MLISKTNKEIFKLFLKLGVIGFGGPAAHIAMMRDEVVSKKQWMNDQQFLDMVGATSLIPGPNSTEMAIHLGYSKGKWKGLIIAGLCFILPAVFLTLCFAWLYKKYGALPEVQPFIYGIKPAIIAIILSAIYPLAKKSLKNKALIIIGIISLALAFFNINEIIILFGTGIAFYLFNKIKEQKSNINSFNFLAVPFLTSSLNTKLFLTFLKIGSILYGSGYVLFAFLDTELVKKGLLPRQTLIDAIAVGQFTPGPVFSSVTFIGYQINSWSGAFYATIGIFLPSFILVGLLAYFIDKVRKSKELSWFLDAVNVASVALIIHISYVMALQSITNWKTIIIAIISLYITFNYSKINSFWIVLFGSFLGYMLHFL